VHRTVVERIAPLPLAKVLAVIFFLLGLLGAILGFLASSRGAEFSVGVFIRLSNITFSKAPILLAVPFVDALVGFVAGFVLAQLYNFVASKGFAIQYFSKTRGVNGHIT